MPELKTVQLGTITYKLPFVDLVPMDARDVAALKASLAKNGRVREPVLCWQEHKANGQETVIDGAHRVILAAELGFDAVPRRHQSFASIEEAQAECEEMNYARRHLSREQLEAHRATRIEQVAELRSQGQSLRAIAEEVGVSEKQVREDVKAATAEGYAVDPPDGEVMSKDGRKRPATTKILCDKCTRLGETKGCPACKDLRRTKPAARKAKPPEQPDPDAPVDAFKNPLPKRCRDVYLDPWIQQTYDLLCVTSETVRKAKLIDGMKKRAKRLPFFDEQDFGAGMGFVIQYLDNLIDHMKAKRPAGVCPACEGKGCSECRSSGLVPRELYAELKRLAKERKAAEKAGAGK